MVSRIEKAEQEITLVQLEALAKAFETTPSNLLYEPEISTSGTFRVPSRLNLLLQKAMDEVMHLPERERKDLSFVLALVLRGQLPEPQAVLCEQLREVSGVVE